MIEVKLDNYTPNESMEIVRELRAKGLVQGKDFDFAYTHAEHDPITGHLIAGRNTVFKFYEEKWATWLILKYPMESSSTGLL